MMNIKQSLSVAFAAPLKPPTIWLLSLWAVAFYISYNQPSSWIFYGGIILSISIFLRSSVAFFKQRLANQSLPAFNLELLLDGYEDLPNITSLILIYMLLLFLSFKLLPSGLMQLAIVGLAVLFPASFFLCLQQKSLLAAIKPFKLLHFLKHNYKWYPGFIGISVLMLLGLQLQMHILSFYLPINLLFLLYLLSAGYIILVQLHCFASLLKNYNAQLELSFAKDSSLLQRADAAILAGNYVQAKELLLAAINSEPSNFELSNKYLRLLELTRDTAGFKSYLPSYLEKLIGQGYDLKAADIYTKYRQYLGSRLPLSSFPANFALAKACEARSPAQALQLLQLLVAANPLQPETPQLLFALASILITRFNRSQEALDVLNQLIKDFPHDSLAAKAKVHIHLLA